MIYEDLMSVREENLQDEEELDEEEDEMEVEEEDDEDLVDLIEEEGEEHPELHLHQVF